MGSCAPSPMVSQEDAVARLSAVRRAVVLAGYLLVGGGAVAGVVAPWLAWESGAMLFTRSWVVAVLVLVAMVPTVLALAAGVREEGYARDGWGGAWGAVGGAVIIGATLLRSYSAARDPHRVVGAGPVLELAAGAALLLGWLAVLIGRHIRGRRPWRTEHTAGYRWLRDYLAGAGKAAWLVGLVVLALLAAGTTVGVRWVEVGRLVDHTTADPLPAGPARTPSSLTRVRWRVNLPSSDRLQVVGGRYVLVPVAQGLRLLDARTGRERWHYLRRDQPLRKAAASADGRSVVAFFGTDTPDERPPETMEVLGLALDTATGAERWAWPRSRRMPQSGLDNITAASGRLLLWSRCGILEAGRACDGRMIALDDRTGREVWRWSPDTAARSCELVRVVPAGSTLGLLTSCTLTPDESDQKFAETHDIDNELDRRQRLTGLSPATGARRWVWVSSQWQWRHQTDTDWMVTAGDRFLVGGYRTHNRKAPPPEGQDAVVTAVSASDGHAGASGYVPLGPTGAAVATGTVTLLQLGRPGYRQHQVTAVGLDRQRLTVRWTRPVPVAPEHLMSDSAATGAASYAVSFSEDETGRGTRHTVEVSRIDNTGTVTPATVTIPTGPVACPEWDGCLAEHNVSISIVDGGAVLGVRDVSSHGRSSVIGLA